MEHFLDQLWLNIEKDVIGFRRDVHAYPEGPLFEYRTASKVVEYLDAQGIQVLYGDAANNTCNILSVLPNSYESDLEIARAISTGGNPEIIEKMKYGKTGVIAILNYGDGPVFGLRCDMDAVEVTEQDIIGHRPTDHGFRSKNEGWNHACGHDAHTAIGIGVARAIKKLGDEGKFKGTLKLFFEPAEEIFAGARMMIDSGQADDLDYMFAIHMAVSTKRTGQIAASIADFPTLKKYNVRFLGLNSHADFAPEQGNNALLAACSAALHLMGISRHSHGSSRINVASIASGSPKNLNAVPGSSDMLVGLGAFSDDVFSYLENRMHTVLQNAAGLYDCTVEVQLNDRVIPVESVVCNKELIEEIRNVVSNIPEIDEFIEQGTLRGAGEDASLFIKKAQENGGMGTYILFGSDLSNQAHTKYYDVDEETIKIATKTMIGLILSLSNK